MKKLKVIKNNLKKQNKWSTYKKEFKHKQMKFLFTKIALIYNPDIDTKILVDQEIKMLNATNQKNEFMFQEIFSSLNKFINQEMNWSEFGVFVYYVYQTSIYYKDIRKGVKNVFNKKNIIETNTIKREHFYNWMHSLDIKDTNFNINLMQVEKVVF